MVIQLVSTISTCLDGVYYLVLLIKIKITTGCHFYLNCNLKNEKKRNFLNFAFTFESNKIKILSQLEKFSRYIHQMF